MLEESLVSLGSHLESIHKTKAMYTDKDSVFRKLSEKNLPLELPALSYYDSNINPYNVNSSLRGRTTLRASNTNNHVATVSMTIIKVDVSITLIASSLQGRLKLAKGFFDLKHKGSYVVSFNMNGTNVKFDLPILDISGLSNPPEGKEGHDYDRGTYYVYEGSFSFISAFLYTDDVPLIRETLSSIEL